MEKKKTRLCGYCGNREESPFPDSEYSPRPCASCLEKFRDGCGVDGKKSGGTIATFDWGFTLSGEEKERSARVRKRLRDSGLY